MCFSSVIVLCSRDVLSDGLGFVVSTARCCESLHQTLGYSPILPILEYHEITFRVHSSEVRPCDCMRS